MRLATLFFPVFTLVGALPVYGSPTPYIVHFRTTAGFPATPAPAGSFVYDPALPPGSNFSAFNVVWEGIAFDLTSAANNAGIFGLLDCGSSRTTLNFLANCPITGWSAGTNPSLSTFSMIAGTSVTASPTGGYIGFQDIVFTGVGGNPEPYASGTFQITATVPAPVYISDNQNSRIRMVNTSDTIGTYAGDGTEGYSGDSGAATKARLHYPFGVALDGSGNLYIADTLNNRVRMVDVSGKITTVAGNGAPSFSGDSGLAINAGLNNPTGVAVDVFGDLFIADEKNNRIRMVNTSGFIDTVAGNGGVGSKGDGGLATSAELYYPTGVAVDGHGNLFIADSDNNRVRKVDTSGFISTVAGNGTFGYNCNNGIATSVGLHNPYGVAVDSGDNLFIADYGNQCIRKVDTLGNIATVAGNGTASYGGDFGPATSAQLNNPTGVAVDSLGNLYIADYVNNRIRKVETSGIITTIAGNGLAGYNGDGELAVDADLYEPTGVAVAPLPHHCAAESSPFAVCLRDAGFD